MKKGGGDRVALIVLIVIVAGFGFYVIGLYNGLVRGRNEVKSAWSSIDVQLKRRYDLIPNLIETVKGYAGHERQTFEAVTKARQQAISFTGTVEERGKVENMLSQTLRSLFAVAEAYPNLKANQNFLALQEELATTENKIGFSRQYYNDTAKQYKNRIEVFPSNVVAGMFGFKAEPFFQVETAGERVAPQVKIA
jgi:LemA protein